MGPCWVREGSPPLHAGTFLATLGVEAGGALQSLAGLWPLSLQGGTQSSAAFKN